MDVPRDHIIVGVDVGFTYTGVAIGSTLVFKPKDGIKPLPIQDWPWKDEKRNKVPTSLTYKAGDRRIRLWGFGCPQLRDLSPQETVREFFKFYLDGSNFEQLKRKNPDEKDEISANIENWFVDYLTQIYAHVTNQLKVTEVDLDLTIIEYIFSLPTDWKDKPTLVEAFERIILQAGFGSAENASARTGLTEAVASAVYTAKSVGYNFEVRYLYTTVDICVLRVKSIDNKTIELGKIGSPLSIRIGSVDIDNAFKALFEEKLSKLKREEPELFHEFVASKFAADQVTRGEFQIVKEKWGQKVVPPTASFAVPRAGDSANQSEELPAGQVETSDVRITFSPDEIEKIFNKQIDKITFALDKKLENVPETVPNLILTGGLGSSQYVQSKIAKHFEKRGMRILVDRTIGEPPLSVCKGIVYDRMQRLVYGNSVMRTRHSRASYGILFNKIYNKSEDKGRQTIRDPVDGKKYVKNEIYWFLEKGDEINEDIPARFSWSHRTTFENPNETWRDVFVSSRLPPELLPQQYDERHTKKIEEVISTAVAKNFTSKRTIPVVGKKFLEIKYDIQVAVDEDNLRIQTSINGALTGECRVVNVPWEFRADHE
ncbi:hypothetical protein B0J14DRAFT_660106 [Halenospora varia]|nr:hypothetical protein B0J14DRAFT_660106 [Halenospora varia]